MWLVRTAHTEEQVPGVPRVGGWGPKGGEDLQGGRVGGGSDPHPYNTQDGRASSTASSLKFNLPSTAPCGLRFAALGP